MRFIIKNIGKLTSADIDIDGIAVIAGENNTGKSTISKSLYSVFRGLYDIESRVKEEKRFQLLPF